MASDLVTCPVCNGDGWLYREKDASALYKRPVTVRVSRVCPYCLGHRVARPLPVYEREPEKLLEDDK